VADDPALQHVQGGANRVVVPFPLVVVRHGCRSGLSSAAGPAGCGRAPGSGSSHPPTARRRARADRHRDRRYRGPW
jgi:hypothetical protein